MKILVTGAKGQVGSEIIKLFAHTDYQMIPATRDELNCNKSAEIIPFLSGVNPDLIINAAAYTAVDKAEDENVLAQQVNVDFVQELARFCNKTKIPLVHLSTDYVFDGVKIDPYCETDIPNPQGVYAKSKLAGEQAITANLKDYIILRVSWVFGIQGSNFVKTILNLASSKEELKIVADQWGNPTAAPDIARVILALVQKVSTSSFDHWGIYHYSGDGTTNWYEFARVFLEMAKEQNKHFALKKLHAIKTEEYITKAARPKNSVLNTNKIQEVFGIQRHSWKNYLPDILSGFAKKEEHHGL